MLAVLGLLVAAASVAVTAGFRGASLARAVVKIDLGTLRHGYRTIFANPNVICYGRPRRPMQGWLSARADQIDTELLLAKTSAPDATCAWLLRWSCNCYERRL